MITLRKQPFILLLEYSIILVFSMNGLLPGPYFTREWWVTIALLVLLCIQVFFFPIKQKWVYPYLAIEAGILLCLTTLKQDFMFLFFLFSSQAGVALPLQMVIYCIGIVSVGIEAILITRYGFIEGILSGLAPIIGFFSFGVIYHLRERAENAQAHTQRLVDELREANQKLEAYARQVQELATVEERSRIARDLHDSVKQQAFAASAQIGAARSLFASNPPAAQDHLLNAEALMDEVRHELNQMIYELRPAALQNQGLASGLREWSLGWSQQSGIPLDVFVQGERALPPETEQALFRIAQEALSNIARHSKAQKAEIYLVYEAEKVLLSILDDGQGFDLASPGQGIGLHSMRERAERLPGGWLEIESAPGRGTQVKVQCSG